MNDLTYRGLPVLTLGTDVPDVQECYGYNAAMRLHPNPVCPQCDGHDHEWCVVHAHDELTIRCNVCGGRCCSTLYDWQEGQNPCILRRHHADYHVYRDGGLEPVSGFWLRTALAP